MVFGGVRDRNIRLLYRLIERLAAVPRVTGGEAVQPVFVDDLAAVLCELIMENNCAGETLTYGGTAPVQIGEITHQIAAQLGKPTLPINIPVLALAAAARVSGFQRRARVAHAVAMLRVARVAPDPNSLGLSTKATPWDVALPIAIARYRSGADTPESPSACR